MKERIILLAKMLFFYEETVGCFESENILDLFSYYYSDVEGPGKVGFYNWLKEAELEKEWKIYRDERGIDESYSE